MTCIFKKTIAVFAVLCMFLGALTACDASVDSKTKRFVKDFFAEVEAGNYEEAETYLHPSLPADLERYFGDMEQNEGIDFQSGIKIEKFISYSAADFDPEVSGKRYDLKVRARVSGIGIRFAISIVDNVQGYGIYSCMVDG